MQAEWIDNGGPISDLDLSAQGVFYRALETTPEQYQVGLDELRAKRGYVEQDIVELRPETPNLETICAKFVDEHIHDDDEVRFVLDGEGVFDIRSLGDRWMRITVEKGDLIVVPANRNHRFMLTEKKNIRCVRLFKDASGWVPHYRIP